MIVRDSPATAVLPRRPTAIGNRLAALRPARRRNALTALLVVVALISVSTPDVLTTDTLMGVFRSVSLMAIMSIGLVEMADRVTILRDGGTVNLLPIDHGSGDRLRPPAQGDLV